MRADDPWESLDGDERRATELCLVDALALAAAGPRAPGIAGILDGIARLGGGDVRTIWTDLRGNAPATGLATSLLIHGWDFDDTHDEAVVHTASVAVAAACAVVADDRGVTGRAFLDGVVAGIQTLSRLARLVGPRPGVIRTAGLGAVAAAVGAATALGADPATRSDAAGLALTSSLSPSTRQAVVDGSIAKRLQPGLAVQTGVTAALLALAGVEGPAGWLNGSYGLLPDSSAVPAELLDGPFEGAALTMKPYPACRYTHAAVRAAIEILPRVPEPAAIAAIRAHVPAGEAYRLIARPYRPRGAAIIDAQFSLAWQLAAVAVTGDYDLATLAGPALADPAIAGMTARIAVEQDLPATASMAGARVEVEWTDGRRESRSAVMPWSPEDRPEPSQVLAKADSCLRVAGVRDLTAADLLEGVRALPDATADGTRAFLDRLRPPAPSAA